MRPGDVLDNRFKIQRTLGEGGLATVYLATGEQGEVSVKEYILAEEYDVEKAAKQFRAEAEILFTTAHPRFPQVIDFLAFDNRFYLVMEYIPGESLEDTVHTHGVLDEGWVLTMLTELVQALDYLHTHRPAIVYRDLKPSNVIVTPEGGVRLIDFGIAKLLGEETHTFAKGAYTPGYAAPEQYGKRTDQRTDLYALGATTYFALTAVPPPPSVSLLGGIETVRPLKTLRSGLSEITVSLVEWLMQLKLGDRPQSAAEVRQAMRAAGVWHAD